MKQFCLKIIVFLFPLVFIAMVMEISLRRIPNDYLYKKEYLDKHAKDIETLVLGSSHSYYDIDPIYFSRNTFNASYVSQSLKYDLMILEKYEDDLVNLKDVILPISYFSLFVKLETGLESWRVKNYVLYYDMNASRSIVNYSEVLRNNLDTNLIKLISYYIKKDNCITCTELGWGTSYQSDKSKDLEETGMAAALRHTKKDLSLLNENMSYLKNIIEICKDHNVCVLLFTPPAFETYRKNVNQNQLNVMLKKANELSDRYNNCFYLNLFEENIFVAADYYDADHLNEIGAMKLSKLLNSYIKSIQTAFIMTQKKNVNL